MQSLEEILPITTEHLNKFETCLISTYSNKLSEEENARRNERVRIDVCCIKYAVIRIMGAYIEGNKEVLNNSLLVINTGYQKTFTKDMLWICKNYNLDSILLASNDIQMGWYNSDKQLIKELDHKINLEDIKREFEEKNGKNFQIFSENLRYIICGTVDRHLAAWRYGNCLREYIDNDKYGW